MNKNPYLKWRMCRRDLDQAIPQDWDSLESLEEPLSNLLHWSATISPELEETKEEFYA